MGTAGRGTGGGRTRSDETGDAAAGGAEAERGAYLCAEWAAMMAFLEVSCQRKDTALAWRRLREVSDEKVAPTDSRLSLPETMAVA